MKTKNKMGYGDYMPTGGGYHKKRTGKKMTFGDWKKLKKQKQKNKEEEKKEFLALGDEILAELDELGNVDIDQENKDQKS